MYNYVPCIIEGILNVVYSEAASILLPSVNYLFILFCVFLEDFTMTVLEH